MSARSMRKLKTCSLDDMIRDGVAALLAKRLASAPRLPGAFDRWTRRRIEEETMAKVAALLESGDPAECCYQNLIREINSEAEVGVLLANGLAGPDELRSMCIEPGVSGELFCEVERIAPVMFVDEPGRTHGDADLLRASLQVRYNRARLASDVSELIMRFFFDSADSASDMTNAMRSMFYEFHEGSIRRRFGLGALLDEREMHDLSIMVSELIDRARYQRSPGVD